MSNVNPASNISGSHLLRLLMLSSTALPVGAYCYSQGVETAIDQGQLHDEASALAYFKDVLTLNLGRFELPLLARLIENAKAKNWQTFNELAELYRASRETRELLAEVEQMAFSLTAWIKEVLGITPFIEAKSGFLPVYATLVAHFDLAVPDCLTAWAFTLLENQVLAAVKTIPLGQMAGQRILWEIQQEVPATVSHSLTLAAGDSLLSSSLPGLAMASMQHESQYSRLFRS